MSGTSYSFHTPLSHRAQSWVLCPLVSGPHSFQYATCIFLEMGGGEVGVQKVLEQQGEGDPGV